MLDFTRDFESVLELSRMGTVEFELLLEFVTKLIHGSVELGD